MNRLGSSIDRRNATVRGENNSVIGKNSCDINICSYVEDLPVKQP